MANCVVGASVGIKLFLVEDGSEAAHRLFAKLTPNVTPETPPARFYVPDLFFVECGNILWKYVRRYGYAAGSARQDMADLQALRLQTVSTADLLTPAFELALQYDLTTYDACYAALAQQLSLPLITADVPLTRKLAGSGIDARTLTDF